jgi:hypothetical protein
MCGNLLRHYSGADFEYLQLAGLGADNRVPIAG